MQTKKELSNVEIERGNRSIADFMGIEFGKAKYSYRPGVEELLTEDHLNYHGSWSWLMPVVEKIKTVSDMGTLGNTIAYLMSRTKNTYTAMDSIEDLWLAIVKFIQWYNNQQKQVKE